MRLRRLTFAMTTLLLSDNELLDHVRVLSAHHYLRCYSADSAPHASKHTGPSQMWAEHQYSLHQSTCIDSFIYCEEKYKFRSAESEERPTNVEDKPTDSGVTSGGYTKVQAAPCAYEQCAQAK